jgi:hypothetical protein
MVRAVSDGHNTVDGDTMKIGLLMESAQVHQKLAEAHLERLQSHMQELDGVVREEIRRTLIEELRGLTEESKRAAQALRCIKRTANLRAFLWSIAISITCTAIPSAIAHWTLPSDADIAILRAKRDELASAVSHLEQQGGRAEWRRCGDSARLCVRVEPKLPVYGDKADYYIVKEREK